jgi:hypothetical protein
MPTVYSLYRARKQRDSVVFKCINISDINIEKIFVYVDILYEAVKNNFDASKI